MITIRRAGDRGHANHGWLDSYHTFSFADYFDPSNMGFSVLRVINEDVIDGGAGFPTHGHSDMEIITYIVDGAIEHKDSMGTSSVIHPGDIQRMSAGTGVRHSEYNHFTDQKTHLLRIWIVPDEKGIQPSYEQKSFRESFGCSDIILVASHNGRDGTIRLNQDVDMYVANAKDAGEKRLKTFAHRHIWIQVVHGNVLVDGADLKVGDGAGMTGVSELLVKWGTGSEFILFDMP